MPLIALNFAEELQDWIAQNSNLDLVVGTNFLLGDILDLQDMEDMLSSNIVLTMFEEGGRIRRTGRKHIQDRSFRFVYKGDYGQHAVNRAWELLQFLENRKTLETTTFTAWLARPADKLPSVIAADRSRAHLADFVVTYLVFYRTG